MVERGCGKRVEDGLYICVSESPFGKPIDFFLIDPPIPFPNLRLRSPMLVEDRDGIVHLVLGIGATYYPFVSDYVEEARVLGISKRVKRNFDPSVLTPFKSKLLLVHPRAIPEFDYSVETICPRKIHNQGDRCVKDLWSLSALKSFDKVHAVQKNQDEIIVSTPSTDYVVSEPYAPKKWIDEYSNGIILAFNSFHFEYINKKGKVPQKIKNRITKAGFSLKVMEE